MVIELGKRVRCKVTGFEGTATARTEFLNGCIQIEVQPKTNKDADKMPETTGIDEQQLEEIEKKKVVIKKKPAGGPMRRHIKR